MSYAAQEKEMTSLVRSIGMAGGILVLAGVQSASAQILDTVEFTTSFPFTVGNATVPAGRYTIRPDDENPEILHLTGAHASVLFQTEDAQAGRTLSKTEVVFKRYGDAYVLKNIWLESSASGAETVPVEGERHLAKNHGSATEQRIAARKKVETSKNRQR
jgi:hypothetical protein